MTTDLEQVEMTSPIINITQAEALAGYRIRMQFDDGSVQVVDFEPFLRRARHPDIQTFLDVKRFAAFRIEFGNLVWGDFEMCFPIIDLHANSIDKRVSLEEQV